MLCLMGRYQITGHDPLRNEVCGHAQFLSNPLSNPNALLLTRLSNRSCAAFWVCSGLHLDVPPRRLAAIVAHLRKQLPATPLLLAGLLPRGFGGDWIGQWQTRRKGAGDFDWPNPFTKVSQRSGG